MLSPVESLDFLSIIPTERIDAESIIKGEFERVVHIGMAAEREEDENELDEDEEDSEPSGDEVEEANVSGGEEADTAGEGVWEEMSSAMPTALFNNGFSNTTCVRQMLSLTRSCATAMPSRASSAGPMTRLRVCRTPRATSASAGA